MQDTLKHKGLRIKLVEQLVLQGIQNPEVLNAVKTVPRHYFMSPDFEHFAYRNQAFSIGSGQTISQPYTVAKQTELLCPVRNLKVLEIGTGSGYQAAILHECGAQVFTIERIESLHHNAVRCFRALNYAIHAELGDGTLGMPQQAPFHRILVTAAAPHIPKSLFNQLAIGGILVIPVGKTRQSQVMVRVIKKSQTDYVTEQHGKFAFVPLIGQNGWENEAH